MALHFSGTVRKKLQEIFSFKKIFSFPRQNFLDFGKKRFKRVNAIQLLENLNSIQKFFRYRLGFLIHEKIFFVSSPFSRVILWIRVDMLCTALPTASKRPKHQHLSPRLKNSPSLKRGGLNLQRKIFLNLTRF